MCQEKMITFCLSEDPDFVWCPHKVCICLSSLCTKFIWKMVMRLLYHIFIVKITGTNYFCFPIVILY